MYDAHYINFRKKKHFQKYLFIYASTSKWQNQKVDDWVIGHLVTQFQGQILRAAENNRVCGHASTCGHAPTVSRVFVWEEETPWTVETRYKHRLNVNLNKYEIDLGYVHRVWLLQTLSGDHGAANREWRRLRTIQRHCNMFSMSVVGYVDHQSDSTATNTLTDHNHRSDDMKSSYSFARDC